VVTRPPCRQCLRQLIVTGVSRVCFLGHADAASYPFHADAITGAITGDSAAPAGMRVLPFSGVTPRGYGKAFGSQRTRPLPLGSVLVKIAGDSPISSSVPLVALLRAFAEPARS